jgi:hypothetical protein
MVGIVVVRDEHTSVRGAESQLLANVLWLCKQP